LAKYIIKLNHDFYHSSIELFGFEYFIILDKTA